MISDRLKEVRDCLGMSQQAMADKLGVSLRSQQNYEAGNRTPDAEYLSALAAVGADVLYVLTGQRGQPAAVPPLKPDEVALLDNYRHCNQEGQAAVAQVALVAAAKPGKVVKKKVS